MAIENFKQNDILVLFLSVTDGYSYSVGGCAASPEDQINSFPSVINNNANEAPSFQIKKHTGSRSGQCVRNLTSTNPEDKIRVLSAGLEGINYSDAPGTSTFLQICWTEAGHSTTLESSWASSIGSVLTVIGSKFSDLNKRAEKALQTGSDRSAGRLIFACEPFAKEAMRRLYGLTKTMQFNYQLESSIGLNVPIVTSANGDRYFNVTYKDKTSGSSATKNDCVKGLIIVDDQGSALDVRVDNVITESALAALNVNFANAAGIPATSSAWINQVDNFVNKMDAYRQGTGSFPSGGLSHSENIPGGGLFAIRIVPQTSVRGAVFAVRAAFSIGTNANGSLTVKFETFTLEFSPNAFLAEREMIKQLRARYKEAMENYQRELNSYLDTVTQPGGGDAGGPIVPTNPSPPPTETLPPPDTIPVPPAGEAPSRESVPETPAAPGNLDVDPPPAVTDPMSGETTVIDNNSGSQGRVTDATVPDAVILD